MKRISAAFAWLLLACGTSSTEVSSVVEAQGAPVVGGQHEARFDAVGYLMIGDDASSLSGPNCGVTLITPRAAITAAHCIALSNANAYGVGFGDVDSGPAYPARAVFVHPQYDPNGSPRYHHDVAILALDDRVNDRSPAQARWAASGVEALYVGYGRVTSGGSGTQNGYTGERKSAYQKITRTDDYNVWVTGDGGGLCWGDSGGPLLDEGSASVYGVLSDFDGEFYCKKGNKMIFTSIANEWDFVSRAAVCADADDPWACMR